MITKHGVNTYSMGTQGFWVHRGFWLAMGARNTTSKYYYLLLLLLLPLLLLQLLQYYYYYYILF